MSPTSFPYTLPPPPPPTPWRPPRPPTPWRPPRPPTPWRPPPPDNSSSKGGLIAGIFVAFVAAMVLYIIVTNLCKGARTSRARAGSATRPPPDPPARRGDERQQLGAASPTARLPAFTYSRSVKHNVTGGGEEAATCSVCLGAFHLGETVRLLPACLHLYHAECIDPWLDAHSTCPLCRSDTDPAIAMDNAAGRRPPV